MATDGNRHRGAGLRDEDQQLGFGPDDVDDHWGAEFSVDDCLSHDAGLCARGLLERLVRESIGASHA
eukprot:11165306-Lingulodinium_polyedra.AAC.1